MAISNLYPISCPALNLDFANVKFLDPRITFTRASSARYYNGVTTAKAEENLLLQSQAFDTATSWAPQRSTITANSTAAPDGTTTADSLTQASGQTTFGNVFQTPSINATTCTLSIFAKPNGKNFIVLQETLFDNTIHRTWFDVQNGTVGTTDSNHTASIVASTNGFYRCSITFTPNAARTAQVVFGVADINGSLVVTDSGGLFIWGAQLEQRSAVSAYTVTTTQPITNYIPVLLTATDNVARFDHNPVTSESLGLLIEEQRTNLVTYSEQFADAAWAKINATITANTIVAPDGTLTGDALVEDTTNNTHYINRSLTGTTNTNPYTSSIYAKRNGRDLTIQFFSNPTTSTLATAQFNLTTGVVVGTSQSVGVTFSATITPVGNNWYRCTATATLATADTSILARFRLSNLAGDSYLGDGYSGIYIWGAQLEAGAFATSYIPTVASQVTRSQDTAVMTGTNFSSWYNQAEGTLYAEASTYEVSTGKVSFSITDGSATNRIHNGHGTSARGFIATNSVTQMNQAIASVVFTNNTFSKVSVVYANNNGNATANGTLGTLDTVITLPLVNQATIGALVGTNSILNGTIKKLAYYPKRLSDTNLQALTA
jgi:hypothetical protein